MLTCYMIQLYSQETAYPGKPRPRPIGPEVPTATEQLVPPPCTACPERSRGKRSGRALLARTERSERALRAAERSRQSPLPTHPLFLFANRGYARLEIVPSLCKQRATALPN